MRLICPNCGAQYEVDDSLIPDAGRDVQCSNCGHAWFQRPAHLDHDLAEELGTDLPAEDEDEAPPPAAIGEPPRSPIDDSVRGILAEEAERESRARRGETGLETQADLGLEAGGRRGTDVRDRMARLRGLDTDDRAESAAAAIAAATAAGSRRDLLPDIEEINSSLRSAEERDRAAQRPDVVPTRRGGFGTGFLMVVILFALATAIYLWAPEIARAVPALGPALEAYVAWADRAREWLDGVAQGWVQRLTSMVDALNETDAGS